MACLYRARLNHLWSLWYCIIVVLAHAYLVYLGIERYKLYSELQWPVGKEPRIWLTVYGVLHAFSVCLLPLFIATAAFKTGNLASDNDRLGDRAERTVRAEGSVDCCSHKCKSIWQHLPPVAQTVHALMAFSLLMAQQLMVGVMYQVGLLRETFAWSTELDVIFQRTHLLARNIPGSILEDLRIPTESITTALGNQAVAIRLVPMLTNFHLFGIPLEFVHYFVALMAIIIVYPSVFWRASKWFSCVFSLHLLVHMIDAIFGYIGFSLLFRVQLAGHRALLRVVNPPPFLLTQPYLLIAVYLGAATVVYLAGICVYGYGYNKFYTCWAARRSRLVQISATGKPIESSMTRSMIHGNAASALCCEGYGPHIAAIGMLVVMVVIKAPIMYDLMVLYQQESPPILFVCIVADVVYLFWWIILWLALTLKRDWSFHVLHSVPELICMQQADRQPGIKSSDQERKREAEMVNALLLVHGDEAFFTTDDTVKISILRQAQKYGVCPNRDDAYWLRGSSGHVSPSGRRTISTVDKTSPEANRLLPDAVVIDPGAPTLQRLPPGYQTLDRSRSLAQQSEDAYSAQIVISNQHQQAYPQPQPIAHLSKQPSVTNSYTDYNTGLRHNPRHQQQQDPVSTFGTLPRSEMRHQMIRPALQMEQQQYGDNDTVYVHKQPQYAQSNPYMDTYGTIGSQYARPGPPQARVLAMGEATGRSNGHYGSQGNYGYAQNTMNSMRQSPNANRNQLRQAIPPTQQQQQLDPAQYAHSRQQSASSHLMSFGAHQETPTTQTSTFLPPGSHSSSLRSPSSDQGVVSGSSSSREETPIGQQRQQQNRHDSDATLTGGANPNAYYTHGTDQGVYQVAMAEQEVLYQHPYQDLDRARDSRTPPGTLTSQGSYTLAVSPYSALLTNDNCGTLNSNRAKASLSVSESQQMHRSVAVEGDTDCAFSFVSAESGMSMSGQHRHASAGAQFTTSCV